MLEDRQKVEKFLNMITVYIGKFNILVSKELEKQNVRSPAVINLC